jgi:DNA ligase (NAD+)
MALSVNVLRKLLAIPYSEYTKKVHDGPAISFAGLNFHLLRRFTVTIDSIKRTGVFILDDKAGLLCLVTRPQSLQTNVYFLNSKSAKASAVTFGAHTGKITNLLPLRANTVDMFKPTWLALRADKDFKQGAGTLFSRNPDLFVATQCFISGGDIVEGPVRDILTANYNRADKAYRTGDVESHLTDAQFDRLKEIMERAHIDDETTSRDGIAPPSRDKVVLKHTMPSLKKAAPGDDISKWAKKTGIKTAVATDKIDGNSLQLHYKKGVFTSAFTKGDTDNGVTNGRNITRSVALIPTVPKKLKQPVDIDVRGEAYMEVPVFEKNYKKGPKNPKGFKNPRNTIAGAFGRSDPDAKLLANVKVLCYHVFNSNDDKTAQLAKLKALGFAVPEHTMLDVTKPNISDVLAKRLASRRKAVPFEMDGVVLEANDAKARKRIGNETNSDNPAYARAFKVDKDTVSTSVIRVHWKLSKDKYLKPTVYIEPVEIDGSTVTKATGFNAFFIKSNKIGPGAIVEVKKAGDIIPKIERVIQGTKAQMPDPKVVGPYAFNDTGVDIILTGDGGNEVAVRKLLHFFEAVGNKGFKEQTIRKFYAAGYKSVADILKASPADIVKNVGGIQLDNAKKIKAGIMKCVTGISMPKLMYASGCFGRSFGETKLRQIYAEYKDDAVYGWKGFTVVDVAGSIGRLHGFSEETGKAFARGVPVFKAFLKENKGLISPVAYAAPSKKATSGNKMAGQVVCFTKVRDAQLAEWINSQGGEAVDKWSSAVTILIVPHKGESSEKVKKAEAKGIKVIPIADFKKQHGV